MDKTENTLTVKKVKMKNEVYRFEFFWPIWSLSLWINLAKPGNGFIRLFASLGGGNLDQFFWGICWEKAPSFVPRNQCIPS